MDDQMFRSVFALLVTTSLLCGHAVAEPLAPIIDMHNDSSSAEAGEPSCDVDRDAMLGLDFDAFDQTFGSGWRLLAEEDGCSLAAADLIRAYIDKHQPEQRIITFHEAQMRAKGGETGRAIPLFRETRDPDDRNTAFGWNEYVDATIAFLEQDRGALEAARDRLAAIPKPANFSAVDRQGNPVEIQWPPNMNVVDGFLACFDETYAIAYSECSRNRSDDTDGDR